MLKKLFVLAYGTLVLPEVVEKNTRGVISATFITRFPGSLAGEGQDFIVFEAFCGTYSVVTISITHIQSGVALKY